MTSKARPLVLPATTHPAACSGFSARTRVVRLHSVKSRTGLDLEAVGVIERDETGLVQRVTMTFSPLDAAVSLSAELGGIVGEEFGDDLFYDASMNEIAAS
ncbi:hypothetical protein ACC696_19660 [Rhizobium ruizarguesonis]